MARPLRLEFPGAIYHATCRVVGSADDRQSSTTPSSSRLYRDVRDRERFLETLAEQVEKHEIRLYLFCLMATHFHLTFETPMANCSSFMHDLCTAYAIYHNLRHHRHGHLFEGRFGAKLVESGDHLLTLSRYVHLNPVRTRAMRCKPIQERLRVLRRYEWSSYLGYVGRRNVLPFVEYGPILSQMGGRSKTWRSRYQEFVETGLAESNSEFEAMLAASSRSIGSEAFQARVDELQRKELEGRMRPEDVAFRRPVERLRPQTVLHVFMSVFGIAEDELHKRHRHSLLRSAAARLLIRHAGQTQREVAEMLNIGSGSAVSKQLNRHAEELASDRRVRRCLTEVERRLQALRDDRHRGADGSGSGANER